MALRVLWRGGGHEGVFRNTLCVLTLVCCGLLAMADGHVVFRPGLCDKVVEGQVPYPCPPLQDDCCCGCPCEPVLPECCPPSLCGFFLPGGCVAWGLEPVGGDWKNIPCSSLEECKKVCCKRPCQLCKDILGDCPPGKSKKPEFDWLECDGTPEGCEAACCVTKQTCGTLFPPPQGCNAVGEEETSYWPHAECYGSYEYCRELCCVPHPPPTCMQLVPSCPATFQGKGPWTPSPNWPDKPCKVAIPSFDSCVPFCCLPPKGCKDILGSCPATFEGKGPWKENAHFLSNDPCTGRDECTRLCCDPPPPKCQDKVAQCPSGKMPNDHWTQNDPCGDSVQACEAFCCKDKGCKDVLGSCPATFEGKGPWKENAHFLSNDPCTGNDACTRLCCDPPPVKKCMDIVPQCPSGKMPNGHWAHNDPCGDSVQACEAFCCKDKGCKDVLGSCPATFEGKGPWKENAHFLSNDPCTGRDECTRLCCDPPPVKKCLDMVPQCPPGKVPTSHWLHNDPCGDSVQACEALCCETPTKEVPTKKG